MRSLTSIMLTFKIQSALLWKITQLGKKYKNSSLNHQRLNKIVRNYQPGEDQSSLTVKSAFALGALVILEGIGELCFWKHVRAQKNRNQNPEPKGKQTFTLNQDYQMYCKIKSELEINQSYKIHQPILCQFVVSDNLSFENFIVCS